jgi:lysyl-tRNA synthetase class 2
MSTWKELRDNPRLFNIIKTRADIIRLTREFFWQNGFTETDTPIALKLPGQEPYLFPVPITVHDPHGKQFPFYLHTSPEFALKKLLAAGFENVFHITKCFRDYEEFGRTHNTEFTMIEWYRSPGTYVDFMRDTENMFRYIGEKLAITELRYEGKTVPVSGAWERLSVKEAWQRYAGVNLDDNLDLTTLSETMRKKGYTVAATDEYEDVFFKIFLNEIEPYLGMERPTFLYEYPKQLCSLSKECAHDPRYAERAELYILGLELANGFGELTDAEEQKKRLEADHQLRQKLGKTTWDIDADFIAALASGMRPTGGIALGIDRMVVLFTGAHDLNEVVFSSVNDQISY